MTFPANANGPPVGPPTGTVTFVFTDIEGSTRLLRESGDGYGDLLLRHRDALREAFRRHGGWEHGTEGDSFFVVFSSAVDAVAAAIEGQRALADMSWPAGREVRVRMGIHSGEGRLIGGDYVGIDVHHAARIAAAGHGGQVLLSESTRTLVDGHMAPGVVVRDLGMHRLKDFPTPERINQVVVEGSRTEFPPLRAMGGQVVGLPLLLRSMVGRDAALAAVRGLVAANRVVTVTGPGGTGKTRLVQEVARSMASEFGDGAAVVSLESLRDAALIAGQVLEVLGLDVPNSRSPEERLADYLGGREMLLVLDNLEQLKGAADVIRRMLEAGPGVRVLAASQASLRLGAEREYQLDPLAFSDRGEGRVTSPAVHLFLERARAVRHDFDPDGRDLETIATICERLDGLPLAIELAAAQVKVLSPEAILERIGRRIDALAARNDDVPERHRTLRAAVRWSYDLLGDAERGLLRRLSVFVGGARLAEIEALIGDDDSADAIDLLDRLVGRSLVVVRRRTGSEDRFTMLQTIRSVARELLREMAEEEAARLRHAEIYAELAATAEPELYRRARRQWLGTLTDEHDNLRAALETLEEQGDLTTAISMAADLWRFWQQRGHFEEALERLSRLLATAEAGELTVPPAVLSRGEEAIGSIRYWMRTEGNDLVEQHYARAVAYARQSGDRRREAWALYNLAFAYDFVPMGGEPPDMARATALREEALRAFRDLGDRRGIAESLWGMGGNPSRIDTDPDSVRTILGEALEIMAAEGDVYALSWAHSSLGIMAAAAHRFDEAQEELLTAAELFLADGDVTGPLVVVQAFGSIAARRGDDAPAIRLGAAAQAGARRYGAELPAIAALVGPIREAETRLDADDVRQLRDEGAGLDTDAFLVDQLAAWRSQHGRAQ